MKIRHAFKILLLTVLGLLFLGAFSIRERYALVHSLVRSNGISRPEWCRDNEWVPEWAVALIICVRQGPIDCVAAIGEPVNDHWATGLGKIGSIQRIVVTQSQLTDAGVGKLLEIESLKSLALDCLPITGDCFAQLRSRHDQLIKISFSYTNVEDDARMRFDLFPNLIALDADRTKIGNNVINNLTRCENLRCLRLTGTLIDDECGPALAKLRNLEELHVMRTNVSDELLNHLVSCPRLEIVHCDGSKISEAGAMRFKKLRPSAYVGVARKTPDPSQIPQEGNSLAESELPDRHAALEKCVE